MTFRVRCIYYLFLIIAALWSLFVIVDSPCMKSPIAQSPARFTNQLLSHIRPSRDTIVKKVRQLQPISMAWRCSGASNTELIENMFRNGLIKDPTVKQAFLKVDRAHYAPSMAYEDSPQPIGYGATISAPHMHASAIEHVLPYLLPQSNDTHSHRRVLDIGSGSGYLTHVLAELVGEDGMVVGLEHIVELRDLGERNARKSEEGKRMVESGKMRFRFGDGRKGWVEDDGQGGDWDVIHVGAAAKEVHLEMLKQLKAPGCMFIPVDDDRSGIDQSVWRIEKDAQGNVNKKKLFGVRYVPLTDAPKK